MDSPPDGFLPMVVNSRMITSDLFMDSYLEQALQGNQNVFLVQTEDGMYHQVLGCEEDTSNDTWRFYFSENIGENIPGNPRPDSLSLQNIIDNPIRFTLYVNSRFAGRRSYRREGFPQASSGHHMTSSMVV